MIEINIINQKIIKWFDIFSPIHIRSIRLFKVKRPNVCKKKEEVANIEQIKYIKIKA